jgi:hypothetical protein
MVPDWGVLRVSLLSVIFAWASAAVALAAIYAVRSLDHAARLLVSACAAAAPAMLFPPATLLLSSPSPAVIAMGIALIANSARLLVLHANPRKKLQKRRKTRGKQRFFVAFERRGGLSAGVAGALAFQTGLGALWGGYPLAAAVFVVIATAIWTFSSIAKGSSEPHTSRSLPHALLSLTLTLLLSTAIAAREFAKEPEGTYSAGWLDSTVHLWNRVALGQMAKPREAKQTVTKVVASRPEILVKGNELVPGVIFRPEVKREARAAMFVAPRMVRPLNVVRPLSVVFSGEYHLFPTSSGTVQKDATVYRGTPMDAEYVNTSGGPMETEARQFMQPPVDLANCGAIRVHLLSGERTPALATMQLIAGRRTLDLGSEVFGVGGKEREVLEFTLPAADQFQADEIRIVFRGDPMRRNRSAKIAIESFVLLPRGAA